ncbi:MAG: glycosyltransferase family 2 protein [Lachnospiraceae bacterium]|nr:glycosyltransferase family 2 protein [Lachnospiraceae bacterium]
MDKLFIVIPAYNEQENIEGIVRSWYPNVLLGAEGSRLVIIDDGSKDETAAKLESLKAEFPLLDVRHKQNSGHGPSILAGYKYAISEGADYIFQTDSDGQTDPAEFPAFWDNRKRYEMIVGYRRERGDGLGRLVTSRVLRLLIFLTFHVYVKDANTPFRLMKASVLEKEIKYVPKDYFLTNVLISVIFTKRRYRMQYLPITFRPRQGGTNSIDLRKITGIGLKSMGDFVKLNRIISNPY